MPGLVGQLGRPALFDTRRDVLAGSFDDDLALVGRQSGGVSLCGNGGDSSVCGR